MRRALRIAAAVAGILVLGAAIAYVLFPADRAVEPLDRAPDRLVVPGYFDEVFFQGQGFPVARRFVVEGRRRFDGVETFVLPHVGSGLAYKNIQETPGQVAEVNARYAPDPPWRLRPERRLGHYKCMSTSASLVLDWFALEAGAGPTTYVSILDGKTYRGFDPKALDSLYYARGYPLSGRGHLDPVSGVPVPYSVGGFATILEDETSRPGPRAVRDYNLPVDYAFDYRAVGRLRARELFRGKVFWKAFLRLYPRAESERLRRAILEDGPVLAGIKIRFSALHGIFHDTRLGDLPIAGPSGHGVVIVGWIEKDNRLYFLYRETFGACDEERPDCGPAYRIYPIYGFNEAYAFERD